MKTLILILVFFYTVYSQDTLYSDDNFYFASDTSYIFLSENLETGFKKILFKDTLNNLALPFRTFLNGDLDSLVNKNFNPPESMEGQIDSVFKDSLGIEYFTKYFRSPINVNGDTKIYTSFSMGKKYEGKVILFVNAAYADSVGFKYMEQFHNFGFKNYVKPDTVLNIKNRWKPTKNMLSFFDGWAYNVKGAKLYRKETP